MTDLIALAKAWVDAAVDASKYALIAGVSASELRNEAELAFAQAAAAQQEHITDLNRLINKWRPRALGAEDHADALKAENKRLREALVQGAKWFEEYELHHTTSGHEDKAARNRERAEYLRRAQAAQEDVLPNPIDSPGLRGAAKEAWQDNAGVRRALGLEPVGTPASATTTPRDIPSISRDFSLDSSTPTGHNTQSPETDKEQTDAKD